MAHFRKNLISILLTNKCNLNCVYCLTGDIKLGEKITIDFDFAKKGIDDFFDKTGSYKMRFYATGEPTTEFELMKKIKEYAQTKAGDSLFVELQTNGYFSKKIRNWIAKNINAIWISLDAPPDVHDIQRIMPTGDSSRQQIEKNVKYLLANSNVTVGARPTITDKNIYRQVEMVNYYADLGIKYVWTHHQFTTIGKREAIQHQPVAKISLLDYAKNYVVAKKIADELGIFYGSFLAVNFDEKCKVACRSCLPCPHLTPDGYVSACDMAFHGNTPLQDLIYGKWNKDQKEIIYFPDKIAKIQSRNIANLKMCQKCEVAENCAGGCLGEAYFETGDMFGIRPDHCKAVKYLAKHLPLNKKFYPCLHP